MHKKPEDPAFSQAADGLSWRRHWPFAALAVLTVVGYWLQVGRYRIHYMDDAWVMTWAWDLANGGGGNHDDVFRDGGYVVTFGRSMHALYGHVLNVIGWSRSNAMRVSAVLTFGTGVVWYLLGRQLKWSVTRSLCLGFGLVLLDKTVEAGVMCRTEALVVLLMSCSLLAFTRGRYVLSGLLAIGTAEIHPIAVTGLFYILAWTLAHKEQFLEDKRRTLRQVGWFALGCGLGIGWYFLLHWDAVASGETAKVLMGSSEFAAGKRAEWTYLDRHFKWHSQFELLVFVLAFFAWWQQRLWRKGAFPMLAVLCVVVSAFLNARPNGFYTALAFPAFAVMTVHAFAEARILKSALLVLALSFVLETRARVIKHPEYRPESSVAKLRELVPADGLPVAAMNDFWFVFSDRRFMPGDYDDDVAKRLDSPGWEKLYLVDSSFESNRRVFHRIKDHLRRHYEPERIGSFKEHGRHPLQVIRYVRRQDPVRR